MDDDEGRIWVRREEAIARIVERSRFCPEVDIVRIQDSLGRVCAHDIKALHDLPNSPTTRWDGVAVRFDDLMKDQLDTSSWIEGRDYAISNTGVGIEGDYDTVIRIEDVEFDSNGRISFARLPAFRGERVIPVGSEMARGSVIAHQSDCVNPWLAMQIARGGHSEIEVFRRPRVAFIPTGDELLPIGRKVPSGKNLESNSLMARMKLNEWGAEAVVLGIVPDDPALISAAITEVLGSCDIVVINGGSSKGTKDFTSLVLEGFGEVLSHAVLLGPGAHTVFCITPEAKPIIGLSGPSEGAECTIDWYILPLIEAYYGRRPHEVPCVEAKLLTPLENSGHSVDMALRVVLSRSPEGIVYARSLFADGESDRFGGDGFAFLSPGTRLAQGESVSIELRYPYRFMFE